MNTRARSASGGTHCTRRLVIAADEVHLWLVDLAQAAASDALDYALLDPLERARAARFIYPHDRQRFVARRAWLRRVLARYLDLPPQRIAYHLNDHDKPAVSAICDADEVHFNLSHSESVALCAVSWAQPCGVDVERVRWMVDYRDVARRNFAPRERARVCTAAAGEAMGLFFACWTRKEAFIKATGEGMSRDLHSFDVALEEPLSARVRETGVGGAPWYVYSLTTPPGVAAALCTRTAVARLRWVRTPWDPAAADLRATD